MNILCDFNIKMWTCARFRNIIYINPETRTSCYFYQYLNKKRRNEKFDKNIDKIRRYLLFYLGNLITPCYFIINIIENIKKIIYGYCF